MHGHWQLLQTVVMTGSTPRAMLCGDGLCKLAAYEVLLGSPVEPLTEHFGPKSGLSVHTLLVFEIQHTATGDGSF